MSSVVLAQQSLEHVLFPITTSPVDPATLTHEVAIVDVDAQPSGWFNATYTDPNVIVLVRASSLAAAGGDVTLAVGRWRVWWRTTSNPETPVRAVGVLQVV